MKKQLFRFAQYISQALVFEKGNTLNRREYEPAAYPRMFPTAMKNEKNAFAVLILPDFPPERSASSALHGP